MNNRIAESHVADDQTHLARDITIMCNTDRNETKFSTIENLNA